MNKYLPVILFVICIAIAVILAFAIPGGWPAALAIAISGAALAMALRLPLVPESSEAPDLESELSALRQDNAELRTEIANTHSIIDELADVVEQIATVAAEGDGASREEVFDLRKEIALLQSAPAPAPVALPDSRVDEMQIRIAALEGEVKQQQDHDATLSLSQLAPDETDAALSLTQLASEEPEPALSLTQLAPEQPDVAPVESPGEGTGRLRSLIARANGAPDPAELAGHRDEDETAVSTPVISTANALLTPVFEPALGAPVAFIVSSGDTDPDDDIAVLLGHAIQISNELEEANREVLIFLRLSPATLTHLTVRRDIIAAIESTPALQRRLTMLTPQDGFDVSARNTLSAIAEFGCKFALEDVRDWSLDLAGLARSGLRFIMVDGLSMAHSAVEQGGDPRRLAQALAVHDIALIGGAVVSKDHMDAVRSLEPTLVTGVGLGEARELEPAI